MALKPNDPAIIVGPTSGKHSNDRSGFTLVELLIVILIIAMLAGLLLAGLSKAKIVAQDAAIKAEISQLQAALEQYKNQFGEYPPNGGYWGIARRGNDRGGELDNNFNAARGSILYRHFKTAFPNMVVQFGDPQNNRVRVNPAGVNRVPAQMLISGGTTRNLNFANMGPEEALVFFLGGIVYQDSQGTYALTGFGADPSDPFENPLDAGGNLSTANRISPFFEFDKARLTDVDNDGFLEYRPLDSLKAPYVYFRSKDYYYPYGTGFAFPVYSPPNNSNFSKLIPFSTSSDAAEARVDDLYHNANGVQIITAGRDDCFLFRNPATDPPTAQPLSFKYQADSIKDNLSNFASGEFGDAD